MTPPLRAEPMRTNSRGEDLGDVLASIRKLIAQDGQGEAQAKTPSQISSNDGFSRAGTVSAVRSGANMVQPDAPLRLGEAHSPEVAALPPAALAPQTDSDGFKPFMAKVAAETDHPPLSPDRVAALTTSLADAVDAAAARMAETTRRIEEAKASRSDTPFRLHPNALIPSAPPVLSAMPSIEARSLAQHRLSVVEPQSGEATEWPDTTAGGGLPAEDEVLAESVASNFVEPNTAAQDEDVPDLFQPLANELAPGTAARVDIDASLTPGASPTFAHVPTPNPDNNQSNSELNMDSHPLRDLLRDAIREELRGEIGQQFDGDLRRIVREELAAALTEAFGKPAI